jgi:hypothetical protein
MTTFALAVPFDDEQRLVAEAARYGHSVVGRFSGADELAARLVALSPQAVMAVADPQYLNARLVSACDASGVRLVVVARSPEQQRYARSLGIVDALVGEPGWSTLMPHAARGEAMAERKTVG